MAEKFEVGKVVEGKVLRLKPFGAIVSLDENTQGLVHISQVANHFVQDINDELEVGKSVTVKITSIDEEKHRIALSIRAASPSHEKEVAVKSKPRSFADKNSSYNDANSNDPAFRFEEMLKTWTKDSNERQANLNKRNNNRN